MDPDILLIDETLSVGDEDFQEKSKRAMHQRIRSDKTIVLVSHSAATINSLCDRAVWIEEGVSRAVGAVEDVTAAYHDELARRGGAGETAPRHRLIRAENTDKPA